MMVHTLPFVSWEFSFASIIGHHPLLFILALLTLVFTLLLRSSIGFWAQLGLLVCFYAIEASWGSAGYVALTAFQGLLSMVVAVGYVKAINYNNHLILEKIHQIPRAITVHGYSGTRRSFLMMPGLFKRKKK